MFLTDSLRPLIRSLLDPQRPWRGFALFAAVHAALWTLLPALFFRNLPLDIVEALTYGREWQIGHDKLPPLPWWLAEIVFAPIRQDWVVYALAQAMVLGAFALVFMTALRIVGARGALVAVLIADGFHYFGYTAVKFNHDVAQLPFWALAGFALHGALRRGAIGYWVLLGLAFAGALWAKYFVVILILPMALFLVTDRNARPALATAGPYVAAAVALVLSLPHLIWLVHNDFLPFSYMTARAAVSSSALKYIIQPVGFALGQGLWALPALAIASPLLWPRRTADEGRAEAPTVDDFDRRIVAWLAFGPGLTLLALSLVTGRALIALWGYPLWLFLGLWLVVSLREGLSEGRLGRAVTIWMAVTLLYGLAFIVNYAVLPHLDHRYRAVNFPGAQLAADTGAAFRAATGTPPAYVIGTTWVAGNVSRYDPARPRVVIDGAPQRVPWIDLADLQRRGAIVVWTEGDPMVLPPAYAALAARAIVQPPLSLPMRIGKQTIPVGWAILQPQS